MGLPGTERQLILGTPAQRLSHVLIGPGPVASEAIVILESMLRAGHVGHVADVIERLAERVPEQSRQTL